MSRRRLTAAVIAIVLAATGLTFTQFQKYIYGTASWYGDEYRGKNTASGEPFNPDGYTAAHRTLPFGTVVEVENLDNGKKVEVRINDRGPVSGNRVIDVSKKAAEDLGFLRKGTAYVRVTTIKFGDNALYDPDTAPALSSAPAVSSASSVSSATNISTGPSIVTNIETNQAAPVSSAPVSSQAAVSSAASVQPVFDGQVVAQTNLYLVRREVVTTNQLEITNLVRVVVTNVINLPPYEEKIVERDVTSNLTPRRGDFIMEEPAVERVISNAAPTNAVVTAVEPRIELPALDPSRAVLTNVPQQTQPFYTTNTVSNIVNVTNAVQVVVITNLVVTNVVITNVSQPSSRDFIMEEPATRAPVRETNVAAPVTNTIPEFTPDRFVTPVDTNYKPMVFEIDTNGLDLLFNEQAVTPDFLLTNKVAFEAESNEINQEAAVELNNTNPPPVKPDGDEVRFITNLVTLTNQIAETGLLKTNVVTLTNRIVENGVARTNLVTLTNIVTRVSNIPVYQPMTNKVSEPVYNNNPEQQPRQSTSIPQPGISYVVQVGAFSDSMRAISLYDILKRKGFPVFTSEVNVKGRNLVRVRVGYYNTMDEAAAALSALRGQKQDGVIVRIDQKQ